MTVYNFEIVDGGLQMQDTGNVSNRYFRYGFEPKKVFDTRVEIWSFDKCIKTLTFDNFGTIGGVTPTDIDNAVELLNALAKQISSGGGGTLPAGASTESKQDDIITAINNISGGGGDASEAKQDEQIAILGTEGTTPPTISGTGILGYLRSFFELVFDYLNFEANATRKSFTTDDVVETDNTNTFYLLKSIKKLGSASGNTVFINKISVANDQSNDACVLFLVKNPTYNGGVTYTTDGIFQYSNQEEETIDDLGEVIASIGVYRTGFIDLNIKMTGTDEYALIVKPLSNNQDNYGTINVQYI